MEVHHPHHPPKSLKDYISEFIVIFVALTLGFFVENQREHYIEGQREKELAHDLKKDLVADSVDFQAFQKIRKRERNSIQTAIQMIGQKGIQANDRELYFHFYNGVFIWRYMEFRQANLDQIISSGSLRYFKNDSLANAISDLKTILKEIELRHNREKEYFYSNTQPWVIAHLNLAITDEHRKGKLTRTEMSADLQNSNGNPNRIPYFLNIEKPNLASETSNMLRGGDWLMQVTEANYYNEYKDKSRQLIRLIQTHFPE